MSHTTTGLTTDCNANTPRALRAAASSLPDTWQHQGVSFSRLRLTPNSYVVTRKTTTEPTAHTTHTENLTTANARPTLCIEAHGSVQNIQHLAVRLRRGGHSWAYTQNQQLHPGRNHTWLIVDATTLEEHETAALRWTIAQMQSHPRVLLLLSPFVSGLDLMLELQPQPQRGTLQ